MRARIAPSVRTKVKAAVTITQQYLTPTELARADVAEPRLLENVGGTTPGASKRRWNYPAGSPAKSSENHRSSTPLTASQPCGATTCFRTASKLSKSFCSTPAAAHLRGAGVQRHH